MLKKYPMMRWYVLFLLLTAGSYWFDLSEVTESVGPERLWLGGLIAVGAYTMWVVMGLLTMRKWGMNQRSVASFMITLCVVSGASILLSELSYIQIGLGHGCGFAFLCFCFLCVQKSRLDGNKSRYTE